MATNWTDTLNTNTKVKAVHVNEVKTAVQTLINNAKLTSSISIGTITTTGKVLVSNISNLEKAVNSLETSFSGNCAKTQCSSKCESCQDSCTCQSCQSDKCQSCEKCQDTCTCQSCQTNKQCKCESCQDTCTCQSCQSDKCQSCQSQCDCNCNCDCDCSDDGGSQM